MKCFGRTLVDIRTALLPVTVLAVSLFTSVPSFAGGYYWSTNPTAKVNNGGTITYPSWPGNNEFINGSCNGTTTITMSGGVVTWVGGGTPTDLNIMLDYGSAGDWGPSGGSVTLSDSAGGDTDYTGGTSTPNFSSSATYSGTPPVIVDYNFTGTIYNEFNTGLSGATINVPTYTETVTITGGGGSYNFLIIAGPLP